MPPLRLNQKELLGFKRHPFYERNKIQNFLATRNGIPCGRISAIVNRPHRALPRAAGVLRLLRIGRRHGGFLPAADRRPRLARRRGTAGDAGPAQSVVELRGGLLIEGFDTPPTFMMTHNPPYYQRLLEDFGMRRAQDMFAFWGHTDMLSSLNEKLAFVGEESKRRFGITVRSLDRKRFGAEVDMYLDLYNRALSGTWGFVPMSPSEVRHCGASLKQLLEPELICLAEVDGKVIGAVLCLLDYNPRIKQIDGRLFPFGFLKLMLGRRKIKRIRAIATTVVPEYQKWGVGLVVLAGLLPKALAWGVEEAEFSWVLESNHLLAPSPGKRGAKRIKTFRLYRHRAHQDRDHAGVARLGRRRLRTATGRQNVTVGDR